MNNITLFSITTTKTMNNELYKATIEGNTASLLNLLNQDELILDRPTSTTPLLETPLHLAALLGHEQLASQLLSRKPQLALELDSRRSSPLHLAAAKGHVGIVKALLRVEPDVCFACDRDGYNPVHVAAMRGRIEALKEMVRVRPDAARALVKMEKTVLHLCVEYCQFEALKVLLESVESGDLVNCRDGDGNTVLHLAVADKQVEAVNSDIQIRILVHPYLHPIIIRMRIFKFEFYWILKINICIRRISVGYSIILYPVEYGQIDPEKVFSQTNSDIHANNSEGAEHYLTIIYDYLKKYVQFYMINTVSFIASLSIIFLLMSGLPIRHKIFMWILTVITWIAITATTLTYTVTLILMTPDARENSTITSVIGITVFVWICLMTLLLVGHTIRLFVKTIKMLVKPCFPRRRRSLVA
ncbi:26S proteasome regulatory complex, subunit PSMD10 [Handroanthus impetiginosus]|uniref:26S proteasome regulatory complex, subunit PSMD10 n=1 Tax=Handroanthus impetiginosus TaxID=429701 RepID=A0A2G9G4K3_9LAMI|nr:26S proteasome regulatory complex, subunit PSMD10 [Handroanthus impetiginosus]